MGNPTPPPSSAQIATIPDLPTAEALTGGELLWINQGGLDRSVAAGAVGALGGAGVYLPLTGGALTGNLSVSGSLTVGGLAFGTTPNPGDNSAAFATTAFVDAALAGITGVSSFNTRTGAVTLTLSDVTGVGGAAASQFANYLPLAGGAITGALSVGGALTATTLAPGDSSTNVATTAFVANALLTAGAGKFLPLTGGNISGPVTAPTPTAGDNSTNVATTAFVHNAVGSGGGSGAYLPLVGGTLTGPMTVTPTTAGQSTISLNDAAGNQRQLNFETNGVLRWQVTADNSGESGSNNGSAFAIYAYADNGSALLSGLPALSIMRYNLGTFITGPSLTLKGDLTGSGSTLNLYSQNGTKRQVVYCTGGGPNPRWALLADATSESGSNAGSNFYFTSYADNGTTVINNPISIVRSSGVVTFAQPIVNGSDVRQKREITAISDALSLIKQLAGVSYERIGRPGKRELGLLAQDVRSIVPEAVEECSEPEGEDMGARIGTVDEPLLGISYIQLTPLLIEAVKELAAEVEALKVRAATGAPLI